MAVLCEVIALQHTTKYSQTKEAEQHSWRRPKMVLAKMVGKYRRGGCVIISNDSHQ